MLTKNVNVDILWDWKEIQNTNVDKFENPIWGVDCGWVVNYAGPLLNVSAIFYPFFLGTATEECKGEHVKYEGIVNIYCGNSEPIIEEYFCEEDLDVLKQKVDGFIIKTRHEIMIFLKNGYFIDI